ncbi:MAG TPA: HAMP domain-containing sensor histidine kinase [Sphingorhabdus sp.]|nr:HAMP domain-containing sensor histidine kinase [Sphingorhabdus sp.]
MSASRALLENFGNEFVAYAFDEHFDLIDHPAGFEALLRAPGDIPERVRVRNRSTDVELTALVDLKKSDTEPVVGVHLVFLFPEALPTVGSGTNAEEKHANAGMGLGRHFANAVRQPLGRILANAETIGSELNGPILEQYSSYAKDIASAAKHLSELVGDLEDLDAIDRPEFKVAREPVELGDIARRVSGLLALKAADHQITLISPDEDIKCVVVGEFRRVLQIVLNLVGNAIRYSPGGTRIQIIINPTAATISVEDEGPGIPEEDRERVFTKFERLGRSGDGGSGLGLYISRKLARAMGGELSIETGSAGGARFTLNLPIA